jgi:hypothetical protein
MPRPIQQIITNQRANIAQNLRIARRVKTVTTVVYAKPLKFETSRIAAHPTVPFQNRHPSQSVSGQLKRGTQTGRSCAKNNDMGISHGLRLT